MVGLIQENINILLPRSIYWLSAIFIYGKQWRNNPYNNIKKC